MKHANNLTVETIYGLACKEPLVCVRFKGEEIFQDSPAKAREIALMLLECAEAAEQDAFIFEFASTILCRDENQHQALKMGALVLDQFRQWKSKRQSGPQP